ncbi:hypothetical protein M2366_003774 [Aeromonas sp. BIGb0405]|jgi:hypothetical protein|nr:hypothetical protein [Aeromonas sp. BIGb0405]MCS3457657.1 hypothetical protein [Aeromonas sp. BIGb0405]
MSASSYQLANLCVATGIDSLTRPKTHGERRK